MLYTDLRSWFSINFTASILQQADGVVSGEGRQCATQFRWEVTGVHLFMEGRHVSAKEAYLR